MFKPRCNKTSRKICNISCFLNYDAIKKEHSINAEYMSFLQQVALKCDLLLINSHSSMQLLTNQKSRTVSSWLLIGSIYTKECE